MAKLEKKGKPKAAANGFKMKQKFKDKKKLGNIEALKKYVKLEPEKRNEKSKPLKKYEKLKPEKTERQLKNEKKKKKKMLAKAQESSEEDEGASDEEQLTLKEIKELGGNAKDLEMLTSLDGTGNELDSKGEKELKDLIASLKFEKFTSKTFIVKDEEEPDRGSVNGEIQDSTINSTTSDVQGKEEIEDDFCFSFVKTEPTRTKTLTFEVKINPCHFTCS